MKVCIIAEGCYPYVVGGVSSWLQMILEGMPDVDFTVFTIAVDESQRGQFKYTLPANVTAVQENFLMSDMGAYNAGRRRRRKKPLPPPHALTLRSLVMSAEEIPWKAVCEIVHAPDFDASAYLNGCDFFNAAKERYRRDGINCPFSDYLWTLRSMFQPMFTLLTWKIPEADIYHAVSAGYAGVAGALGSALYGSPFLLSEHGIYTREREEELIRSTWTKGYFKDMWIRHFYSLSAFAYEQADTVVSLFHQNAEAQEDLGCVPDKIRIIPNGVSVESYRDVKPSRHPDGIVNIGAVVRVTPIKDIKTMILAFHEVKARLPSTRFYIMGSGDEDPEYYQECLDLIEQLDMRDIELTGRINIRDYLPDMDILVLTSISEGQPLAILEGMLFRKPWVATNVGCCRQLLYGAPGDGEGQAGFVAPVMDVQKLARYILRLANDADMRREMGETGYRRACKYYRLEDMFEAYSSLYQELGVAKWPVLVSS